MCDGDNESSEEQSEFISLAHELGDEIDADVIIYGGDISRGGFGKLQQIITSSANHKKNVFLIITTYGGDPHAGYRIARALKERYSEFVVCVPSYCKSAGTLITLGADQVVITDEGELGPLDIQVSKRDEFDERGSGLDIMQALQVMQERSLDAFRKALVDIKIGTRVTTKLAAETATSLIQGLFAPIYSQIDPVHLGELHRAMSIAYDYGKRLAGNNLKDGALDQLVAGYCSHGFVIDRKEAETLFKTAREPSASEEKLLESLGGIVKAPNGDIVCHLNEETNDQITSTKAASETEESDSGKSPEAVTSKRSEHGEEGDSPSGENVSKLRKSS